MNKREHRERWLSSLTNGQKLDVIIRNQWDMMVGLRILVEQGDDMVQEVDDMNAALEENTSVDRGLATLTDKIFAMLQGNMGGSAENTELKAAIKKTTEQLKAQTAETAAALLRNTPNEVPNPGGSQGGASIKNDD